MEFKAKRESSQNTFFLSSGVLEELDHYLNEPISRNSRILSRKSIPIIGKDLFGNDTQRGEKLGKFVQIIEIEEDVDTLMNFIDIENKRQGEYEKTKKEEILEMEKCFKSFNFFSFQSIKNKSSHENLGEEVKSADPKLDLMKLRRKTLFDMKNNLLEKIQAAPKDYNFEAHGRRYLV